VPVDRFIQYRRQTLHRLSYPYLSASSYVHDPVRQERAQLLTGAKVTLTSDPRASEDPPNINLAYSKLLWDASPNDNLHKPARSITFVKQDVERLTKWPSNSDPKSTVPAEGKPRSIPPYSLTADSNAASIRVGVYPNQSWSWLYNALPELLVQTRSSSKGWSRFLQWRGKLEVEFAGSCFSVIERIRVVLDVVDASHRHWWL